MNKQPSKSPFYFAAIVVPTLCVFGSTFIGSGARTVAASEDPFEMVTLQTTPFYIERVGEPLSTQDFIPSPFYFESSAAPIESIVKPADPIVSRPKGVEKLPPVRVSSILPNGKTPLAIIDGKPRRVGDTLESGWTVLSINGDDFTVTLVHSSGQRARVGIK